MAEPEDLQREKRGNARDPVRKPVRLWFPEQVVHGLTRDLSSGGVFLLTGDDLTVEIGIGDDPDQEPRRVRVVRLETIPGGGLGIAVEFLDRPGRAR